MAKNLTKKEKGFADDYLDTGNGTQSILKNYDTESERVASVMAVENLAKPKIQAYLENNAEGAISRVVELSKEAKNEQVKLNANKDILDRAGYKPAEKAININMNVKSIDPTDPKVLEALKTINKQRANG